MEARFYWKTGEQAIGNYIAAGFLIPRTTT